MKILYKQGKLSRILNDIGIENCCFKHLVYDKDRHITTKKEHHHTGYEIHFIKKGHQSYQLGNEIINLHDGALLVIPPYTKHRVTYNHPQTVKYSLTFNAECDSVLCNLGYVFLTVDDDIAENISSLEKECRNFEPLWQETAQMKIYLLLISILRRSGFVQKKAIADTSDEDVRLAMAKQYIRDNIDSNLRVSEVAAYCYLSCKQLTRLFGKEDTTPADYIRCQRIFRIEQMLDDRNLSLKSISETMSFSSEYQFNTFFHKYAGMPPGEYRKMKQ